MADQTLSGPVPQAPDLSNIAASPYADKAQKLPTENSGIGYANKGPQVAQGDYRASSGPPARASRRSRWRSSIRRSPITPSRKHSTMPRRRA